MTLKDFATRVKGATPFGGLIYAFDPGETTGFCAMYDYQIKELRQIETPIDDVPKCYKNLQAVFYEMEEYRINMNLPPTETACEDYKIYEWKSDDHKWSGVHTIKVVGFVQVLADYFKTPITMRMAQVAKGFCTDEKLRMWGLYEKTVGQKHARDALRHACYHAIFHKKAD